MAVSSRHLQGCVPGGWPMVRSQIQRLKWLAVEPSQQSLRCITLDNAVNLTTIKHLLMAVGRTSVRAQLVKNPPAQKRHQFDSWGGKIPWRRDRLSTSAFLDFPSGSEGKESARNAGDLGSIPGLEWSPGGHSNPLQYFHLENPHGQRILTGYSPWGCKESDTTEQLSTHSTGCWALCK